jgi:hypothetical protein
VLDDLPILKLELSIDPVMNSPPRGGKIISSFPVGFSPPLVRLNIGECQLKVFGL